jgi:glycosyltransferase involved in cell wall biosynthesis
MKILLLTQWFQPESHFMGVPFAKALMEKGHQVQVLTGFPNYPGGKIYDGYKVKFIQKEVVDGVSVIRVPLYPSHDQSAIRRMLNYSSFALAASTIGAWAIEKADVAHIYHPPASLGLPACILRLLRNIPFVYDIKDLWPDTLTASGVFKNKAGIKLINGWCNFIYKKADKIAVCTEGFKRKLIERGVSNEKTQVIYNWCDDNTIKICEPDYQLAENYGLANSFNIIFAGNIGKAQGLDTILKAAQILLPNHPNIKFVFIGDGVELQNLKGIVKENALYNVTFIPKQPMEKIASFLSLADVLLVHLRRQELFEITIPSKLQAYMAVGKPVLNAVNGESMEVVKKADAGLSAAPDNPQNIAETALKLFNLSKEKRDQLGKNGHNFYQNSFSMKKGVEKYETLFNDIIGVRK